jgi:hypothetical protein
MDVLVPPRIPLKFEFSTQDIFSEISTPPEIFEFEDEWQLLKKLADDLLEDRGRFQSRISRDLDANPICSAWSDARGPQDPASHFRLYQETSYDEYHISAERVLGQSVQCSSEDERRFNGLVTEIQQSQISTPSGMIVFHGGASVISGPATSRTRFLSTSLDPVVAINSALRRAFDPTSLQEDPTLTKQIYMFEIQGSLPLLWGHYDGSHEYEILFAPPMSFKVDLVEQVGRFKLIRALLLS